MPRLLLVDDNQRIHQIVETLLTATDIELICASSGAEALERVAADGPFDVALLDTTMQGMDGWELLDRLRHDPATARLPIAMMAGVLDTVDPETVQKAPIQGFLKKPVELRDLADRVRTLMATPVEAPAPEPEPEPEPVAEANAANTFETVPYFRLSDHPLPDASDILILELGDLLPEVPEAPAAPTDLLEEFGFGAAPEPETIPEPAPEPAAIAEFHPQIDSLELEELDLEGLRTLAPTDLPADSGQEAPAVEEASDIPDLSPGDAFQDDALELGVVTDELPDLGPEPAEAPVAAAEDATVALAIPALLTKPAGAFPDEWSDESESLLTFNEEPVPASPALAAMDEHIDFGPDSFLDQEPGPEPTPYFLPEIPENVTPVKLTELTDAEMAELLPGVDEAPEDAEVHAAGADTVPPWAKTVDLVAGEILPEPEPIHFREPEAVHFAEPEAVHVAEPEPVHVAEPEAFHFAEPEAVHVAEPEPVHVAEPEPIHFVEPEPIHFAEPAAVHFAEPEPFHPAEPVAHAVEPEAAIPAAGVVPAPAVDAGADPLAAVLADPVLMDKLAKAVVARLGDQILREIAWEVMPEVADRFHRN